MITQAINLNLIPGQVLPRVNVSQYDYGSRTLEFKLFNGNQSFTLTSSMTANISGTKADMHGFEYDATVDTTNQKIVADLTQQMTATAGDVTCELIIKKSGERLGTCNFVISVEKAALGDDIIISDTELPAIIAEATAQMEAAAQSASEAASSAQAAEESADIAEIYGAHPPYIGVNGNWYVYNVTTQQYEDSGVKAQGPLSGLTDVEITNAQDGQEITYDGTTQKWKNTSKIQTLTNQVKDMNNVYGSKNLLPYPYNETTKTVDGVTFTVNGDGSITLNGTNTGNNTTFMFHAKSFSSTVELFSKLKKMNTSFKLLGGNNISRVVYNIDFYDSSNAYISSVMNRNDTPTVFTIPSNAQSANIFIRCIKDAVYSNLTIYPMLYLASITDDTYEPYAKTNQQLTQDTTALLDNLEVNGAVNMLPYPYKRGNEVINGITSIVDSDGVITLNGTATAATSFIMFERAENKFALPKGSYKAIVKIVSGTYTGTLSHILRATKNGSGIVKVDKSLEEAGIFSISTDTYIGYQINIPSGAVLTNLKLAPMITVASYNGDYVPYAKSNKELTEDVSVKTNTSGLISSVGTIQTQSFQTIGKITILTAQIKVGSSGCAKWSALANWTNSDDTPCPVNTIRTAGYIWDNSAGEDRTIPLAVLPNGQIQPIEALTENDIVGFTVSYIHS